MEVAVAEDRSKPSSSTGKRPPAGRAHDDLTSPVPLPSDVPPETLDLDDLDDIFAEVDAQFDDKTGLEVISPQMTPPPQATPTPERRRPATLPPPMPAASSDSWDTSGPLLDEDPDLQPAVMSFGAPLHEDAEGNVDDERVARRPMTLPPIDAAPGRGEPGAPELSAADEPWGEPSNGQPLDPSTLFALSDKSGPHRRAPAPEHEHEHDPVTAAEPIAVQPVAPAPVASRPEPAPVAPAPEPRAAAGAATRARGGRRTSPPESTPPPSPAFDPFAAAPSGRAATVVDEPAAAPAPAPEVGERRQFPRTTPPTIPPTVPPEEATIFNDHGTFRAEVQRLARSRDWQRLAAVTSSALTDASWAKLPEMRASLLEDLARIYRDRLKDPSSAADVFVRLVAESPANPAAIEFLAERYQQNGEWRPLFDLYAAAIEATWDPDQRLAWTRKSVKIATEQLGMNDLVVEAWERLERLGDALDETRGALSETYRKTARWDKLAEFLARRADKLQGVERVVALREVGEAYLSGMRDQVKASETLEQILAERAADPIALLSLARVLARRKEWEQLSALGARPFAGQGQSATLDFRRLVADALWSAGDLERAIVAHERVLQMDPDDADALRAKEEYLSRTGKFADLVSFLAERAEKTTLEDKRLELLARAAQLAEKEVGDAPRAIALWERHAEVPAGKLQAYRALEQLYGFRGEMLGVARSLEGQLALTRERAARIELLRRLGEHCAHRMGDDKRAEECWKELVSLAPDDRATADELLALQRRRGDYEGLDRTLAMQGWRALDDDTTLAFWRAAAANVEDNLADSARAQRAWWRVLDLAPTDPEALAHLVKHRQAGGPRDAILALEDQLRATSDVASRIPIALEIGQLWELAGERAGALGAYERVLRWMPGSETALAALVRLHGTNAAGLAAAALDVAAAHAGEESGARLALALKVAALVPIPDKLGRFFALRRLLWLDGRSADALAALTDAAEGPEAWTDLATVYQVLASEATDAEVRAALLGTLAEIYEKRLNDPNRAFLTLEETGHDPALLAPALERLGRLAAATGRHEDHLALLDVAARAGAPPEARRAALQKRAAICEEQIGDKERAFQECVRMLALDPHDSEALSEARRLAAARSLWRQLDALYAELWDRAGSNAERVALLRARHGVHALRLESPAGALDQLIAIYRLDPDQPELFDQIVHAAEEQGAWDKVVPILEARVRAAGDAAMPEQLARLAELHEHKRKDPARAFELYAEAFVLAPTSAPLLEQIERLAAVTGKEGSLAQALRLAAARVADPERRVELLRRVAHLAEGKLARPEEALDAHRRILQLHPSEMASLEVVIAHQRQAAAWGELRDSLSRWIELTAAGEPGEHAPGVTAEERATRLLEIARLSRAELGDPETALGTYGALLEIDPGNEAALEGVRSLTEGTSDPALEARRLRLQLVRAQGEPRIELQLALARLQEEAFEDLPAAAGTLETLVTEAGSAGPGFAPLARLLARQKRWDRLLDLHEARAAALADPGARIAALEETIALADQHPDVPQPNGASADTRMERLCRRLLEERPGDEDTRRRLKALYRAAGRHDELAAVLEGQLAAMAPAARGYTDEDRGSDRVSIEDELARLYDVGLGRLADAQRIQDARAARAKNRAELLPAQASLRLRQGDFPGYVKLRIQQAKHAGGAQGALILCHLAEASDEQGEVQPKIAELYREARNLDPRCEPAIEALKAIGRRSKNWRAAAALLPEADEAKMSWGERAARLSARGEAAAEVDPETALGWYQRAVAVDPDHYAAWDALATLAMANDDDTSALAAQAASLEAYERKHAPEPARLRQHAERIQQLAEARLTVNDTAGAARLSRRAHELCPTYPAAALAVADQRLSAGDIAGAHAIFDRVLSDRGEALGDAERLHATYQRGALAARLGHSEQAIGDLRDALRIDPLHAGALNALADTLAQKGRHAAAIQHYTQALLVAVDPRHRGQLYGRLGRLWEDSMGAVDEAGVCYERALTVIDDDRDLLRRGLHLYQKTGRAAAALDCIAKLLPGATDSKELADLWTARGDLLVATDEGQAIESFDMALSYDPGAPGALGGLAALLEKRGEWAQLLDIFEARTETGTPEERASALRHLSRIAGAQLADAARSERYLKQAIDLAPLPEDFEQLLRLYGDDPGRERERRSVIAGLLATNGPWTPRLAELGRKIAESGDRRLAWCLLSPLAGLTIPEPPLKALVLELRKEFEKSENVDSLGPDTHLGVMHSGVDPTLLGILAEVDQAIVLGAATPEAAGASGPSKADARTALGKTFATLAEKLGLPSATLWRAQGLAAPYRILDGETPQVVIRSELLQLLPIPEINLLFATLLEMTRPGARLLCALAQEGDGSLLPALVPALLAAAPDAPASDDPAVAALAERLRAAADDATRARWARGLERHPLVAPDAGESVGLRAHNAIEETARRVGLMATPDLRTAARLLTRLDDTLPKMPTGGPLSDMDTFISGSPPVKTLISYAASVEFGRALNGL
jgi:tetratricopeptide (TPR) repeat protein